MRVLLACLSIDWDQLVTAGAAAFITAGGALFVSRRRAELATPADREPPAVRLEHLVRPADRTGAPRWELLDQPRSMHRLRRKASRVSSS